MRPQMLRVHRSPAIPRQGQQPHTTCPLEVSVVAKGCTLSYKLKCNGMTRGMTTAVFYILSEGTAPLRHSQRSDQLGSDKESARHGRARPETSLQVDRARGLQRHR